MPVTYPNVLTKSGSPEDGAHLVQKGIPKDLRPQFGMTTLRVKMPQRDLGAAYLASKPIVAALEQRIAIARPQARITCGSRY
jgi:hypothetical protein